MCCFTCANVATRRPNVKAIWTMIEGESFSGMMDPHPISTNRSVPTNSADRILQMFLLSVMSDSPNTPSSENAQHKQTISICLAKRLKFHFRQIIFEWLWTCTQVFVLLTLDFFENTLYTSWPYLCTFCHEYHHTYENLFWRQILFYRYFCKNYTKNQFFLQNLAKLFYKISLAKDAPTLFDLLELRVPNLCKK